MPIVNIELKFNDQGAVTGARNLTALSEAAEKAQKSVSGIGGKGSASVSEFGKNAEVATSKIQGLATQVLALVGAYKALQAASAFVARAFDFSSNIEDSQIAIASVLGATNKIADSQGRMLEGAEKFNAAQEISAQMMEKIQVLALKTTANFDDIVQGVSGIIAPATKAGVAMEKLPQFAVTAAQAMTAMKIPVQQMRTEIEALLSGNINKSQDILATNLGITGEMVRNWQQQCTLVEELNKRLLIFAEAGEATAQTWTGLKSNMKDALDYLSSQTGKGLFEGAKQSYRELLALLVSTDQNKLGLNEDVSNLVKAMKELEDEIGNKLLSVTRSFIDYIRELNDPENLADLENSFKTIGGDVASLWETAKQVGSSIGTFLNIARNGWNELPEIVRELGIIGAVMFGAKGKALVLGGAAVTGFMNDFYKGVKNVYEGKVELSDFLNSNIDQVHKINSDIAKTEANASKNPGLYRSSQPSELVGPTPELVGPQLPTENARYDVKNAIGGFDNKKSGGADKIANAREQIQKLREEIDALNGEATKKSNGLDQKEREIAKLGKSAGLSAAEVAQLQDDYAEAFKTNTLKEFNKHLMEVEGNTKALRDIKIDEEMTRWQSSFNELVSRGKMSSEEATESLTRMKTALVNQSEVKDLQTAVQFYKELGELSGQYGAGIEFQNRLLKEQARAWHNAGIPDELVAEMVKLKQLQDSVNGFDGAYRGLLRFTAEYSNEAKQWENITYSWATGFNDTTKDMWGDFLDTGKVSFDSLSLSFTKLLKDMSYQALVQPIVLSIVGVAQNSLYGATTAGQSGGGSGGSSNVYGMASGMAQQYATSQMMNGASSWFGDSVNGWASSAMPGTFASTAEIAASNAVLTGTATPAQVLANIQAGGSGQAMLASGSLPTNTFTGSISSSFNPWNVGSGFAGSALANYVIAPALHMDTKSTGSQIGGAVGGFGGALAGAKIGAMAGSWGGPIGAGVGALAGTLAGLLAGGAFSGGSGSEPGLWVDSTTILSGDVAGSQMEEWAKPNKGRSGFADTNGQGYYIEARARNGAPQSAARSAVDYLGQLSQQVISLSASVKDQLSAVDSSLGSQYYDLIRANPGVRVIGNGEGDDTPDVNALGKQLVNQAYSKITNAVANSDLNKLAVAADGMLSDTMYEVSTSLTKAIGVANISTSMGDYASQYTAAISGKLLDALNSMDTSNIGLTVDKSSLAGWQVAATAIQTMDGVKTSINGILTPASEMTAAMSTAETQMDTWIATLKQLGWQESAIADVESKRLAYLEQYETALTRSSEQNLYLRGMALSAGTDSWSYQQQSLKYQQENELADYAKKYGSEAELLAAKAAQLNKDAYQGKTNWDNNAVYQAISEAGMTVTQWLDRYGRDEGYKQNISMYDQLMYTQQAESVQAEIDYLQKQYNSMLQEQISSAQSLVNSFDRVVDSLDEARRNIWSSDSNISTSRLADARADFSTVYAKAMAGDVDAMAELPSISTNLLNLGKEQIASRDVYQDLFYDVDRKLKDAQGIAKNQYDINNLQLDTLQSQLSTQQKSQLTLAEISAKITALSGDLAAAMAKAAATPLAQTESLLQSKAAMLNQQAYQGRTDWTAQSTQQAILSSGMSVDQWWALYGVGEKVSDTYKSSASTSYSSDMALLAAKAASMNAGNNLASGQTAGGWTAASVAQEIVRSGLTIPEWYSKYGKAEGFATGGITPANQPFWVGENGPELVVSPQQWGVINNTDSMALMRGMSGGGNINSGAIVAAINNMNDTLRQLLTKTDRIMADHGRIRDRMDMFAQEGVTIAAA